MVEAAAGGSSSSVISTCVRTLTTRIGSGTYKSESSSWVSCADIDTANTCALAWAKDSNVLNCQYVLTTPEGGQEITGAYYTNAMPYIELQIAEGGYRLATWLNAFAATQGVTEKGLKPSAREANVPYIEKASVLRWRSERVHHFKRGY